MNKEFLTQTVRDNTNIIDRDDNWNLLLYKEAYHIKRLTPFLNNGLKASRELSLFSWQFRFFVFHFHVVIAELRRPKAAKRSPIPILGNWREPMNWFSHVYHG